MDLGGQLVKLRAFRPADAEPIAAALSDPEVVRYLASWSWRPYSIEDAHEFVNRHPPDTMNWAVECVEDGEFIGATGFAELNFRDRHCFWGIWIAPPSRWGRGYGTEACCLASRFAFRQLGMEKIYLYVFEGNDGARRSYEKAGYRVEATLPRHTWLDGQFIDIQLMAAYSDDPLYAG